MRTKTKTNDDDDDDDDDSIIRDELHALQSIFDLLDIDDANSNSNIKKKKNKPIMDVNKRRTLGFRLTKLQQQANK